jgi:hypothetical protein
MRSRGGEWWLGRRDGSHSTTRHKRLCLGVESVVAVVAPRDWVLALRVMRINVCWELSKSVRNTHMPLRASRGSSSLL